MIVRELADGSALVITQEAHADVAAQFAAHWGNDRFSALDPFQSMLFATVYHDSRHREMEADLPIDEEKGLPYPFRGAPPAVRRREADGENVAWIKGRDPYASLIVSMHHAGLRKGRYGTVRSAGVGGQVPADDGFNRVEEAFADLEDVQRGAAAQLGLTPASARNGFWHNYSCLQVFDLLSLYFCCDGYQDDWLRPATLERVPVAYGSEQVLDLHLEPADAAAIRMSPYPFDVSPLRIAVLARRMDARLTVDEARAAYHQAVREPLTWEIFAG